MADLISKLRQLLRLKTGSKQRSARAGTAELPSLEQTVDGQVLEQLMRMLELTSEEEYSCEETFAVLDEYIDFVLEHEEAEILMPLVKRHLELCVDCREEFEVLLRALQRPPA